MNDRDNALTQRSLSRHEYLLVVQAGLQAKKYTFSRQAALGWLSTYPGDLQAAWYYARALAGEQKPVLALQVLQGLCIADPEFVEAVDTLLQVIDQLKKAPDFAVGMNGPDGRRRAYFENPAMIGALENTARAHRFALVGGEEKGELSASWGVPLWFARQAIGQGDLRPAERLIQELVSQGLEHPLVGVAHLQLLRLQPGITPQAYLSLAKGYHERWPDTLAIMLYLADCLLHQGKSERAVALLHQAAARDVGGQVIGRMWGQGHPFRSLWPERMRSRMTIMVPAIVTAVLGWNRLPAGERPAAPASPPPAAEKTGKKELVAAAGLAEIEPASRIDVLIGDMLTGDAVIDNERTGDAFIADAVAGDTVAGDVLVSDTPIGEAVAGNATPPSPEPTVEALLQAQLQSLPAEPASKDGQKRAAKIEIDAVGHELEKIAARLKVAGLTKRDGRFPVYVLFSVRSRLRAVYGLELANLIESEMAQLAESVQHRPGWGARLIFADDPAHMALIGSKPARPDDPWELKLVLSDLDEALAKQGERIGALLIVGGPEIVPFHLLPNPVDDFDLEIPSDNPYATRDKNYFIPEWPVGRLPGGAGPDARLLVNSLRRYRREHDNLQRRLPWKRRILNRAHVLWERVRPAQRSCFGYTAEIWRQAAANVFRPIGKPAGMFVSPPCGLSAEGSQASPRVADGLNGVPAPRGKFAYFNLHGLVDAPEWYGHRDLMAGSDGPDFPIALRPEDIRATKGQVPGVVFSEACYGMHLQGRAIEEAISLKFLEAGSLAVAGSTCMAYGAVASTSMVAADLLGHTFWRYLKQGMPAGEALRQAKIYLVYEMQNRQGYLDGEDQKTVISFALYGDPLAEPIQRSRVPKSIRYQAKPMDPVRTVCDRLDSPQDAGPVPAEVMQGVQRAVAKYLPGMKDARLAYVCEHAPHGEDESPPPQEPGPAQAQQKKKSRHGKKGKQIESPFRRMVLLSKQVARHGEIHPVIARLTLDERGKLVKMVISR